MHFLKEIPVHEMQKLRKEEEKKGKKSEERKEEWKKGKKSGRREEERGKILKEGEKNGVKKRVESRLRGIERKMERWRKKKREYGRCLLIFLVIQLHGGGQRGEESWDLGAGVSEAQVQASLKTLL